MKITSTEIEINKPSDLWYWAKRLFQSWWNRSYSDLLLATFVHGLCLPVFIIGVVALMSWVKFHYWICAASFLLAIISLLMVLAKTARSLLIQVRR